MTNTTEELFFIDTDELQEAREAAAAARAERALAEFSPMWVMPDDLPITIQFLESPFKLPNWREVYCPEFKFVDGTWSDGPYQGRLRKEIPFGMRDIFVNDARKIEKHGKVTVGYDNVDMIDVGEGVKMDLLSEILDGSALRFGVDDFGKPKPELKVAVNVVIHDWPVTQNKQGRDKKVPQPGDQVLLKFREGDWRGKVVPKLVERNEEGDDLLAFKWRLTLVKADKAKNTPRMAKLTKVGPAEPLTAELFSSRAENATARAAFLNHLRAVYADYLGEDPDTSTPPDLTDGLAVFFDATDTTVIEDAPASKVDYEMLPNVKLRELLTAAGVEKVTSKTARPELLALAKEHL